MQALLQHLGLPPDYVQALDADAAAALAGVPLPRRGLVLPRRRLDRAGRPGARTALATPGVRFAAALRSHALAAPRRGWQLLDAGRRVVARRRVVVLANAADAPRLLAPLGGRRGRCSTAAARSRSCAHRRAAAAAPLPVAGDGYALPLPDGGLLCGATRDAGAPGDDADAARGRPPASTWSACSA